MLMLQRTCATIERNIGINADVNRHEFACTRVSNHAEKCRQVCEKKHSINVPRTDCDIESYIINIKNKEKRHYGYKN